MGNKESERNNEMARKSFISSLPKDVVLELNDVIRQHEYGDHESNVAWLKQKGFQVSRSAMHRYTAELKARDGFDGSAGSFKLTADLMAKDSNLDLLYQELGQIEFRKQEILERIRELTGK